MDDMLISNLIALTFAVSAVLSVIAMWALGRRFAASYQEKVLDTTSLKLSEMFIFMDARSLTKISIAATLIVPIVLLIITGNLLAAILGAAVCLIGPRLVHNRLKAKRRKTLIRQLPDTLDSLVGALRSGMSLQQALGLLGEQLPAPSIQEFSLLVRKLRMGVSLDEALIELEGRISSMEYTMFTTSVRIAREVGGNLTESLERLAETMRRKLAMEDKIEALTSQGKLQGIIVGCLPLFLMLVLNEMEPEAMAPLFNTWMGYGVLLLIFVLELIGFVLIRKIVRIDV
ncbi:type II secretion system F family protein [Massilia sp. CF038]|uniref:type II secretion system F family protein n=1 Tax=Massilia sp. CF038 TaxID=1881045 RepID=UPI0009162824|nr:type II secretion system F family protein [Massilia sp. CF038]SHH24786.1 tight adherence protein B [Massilia sp. CF038]